MILYDDFWGLILEPKPIKTSWSLSYPGLIFFGHRGPGVTPCLSKICPRICVVRLHSPRSHLPGPPSTGEGAWDMDTHGVGEALNAPGVLSNLHDMGWMMNMDEWSKSLTITVDWSSDIRAALHNFIWIQHITCVRILRAGSAMRHWKNIIYYTFCQSNLVMGKHHLFIQHRNNHEQSINPCVASMLLLQLEYCTRIHCIRIWGARFQGGLYIFS